MISVDEKRELILENEYKLANLIARKIIQKPELNIWMILIPIFFLYFFYQLSRNTNAKKDFVHHFVLTRKQILNEACALCEEGEKPDYQEMAENENVPDGAVKTYKSWAKLLFEHYHKLLTSEGDSYPGLIRESYENRDQYLSVLDPINREESKFYAALLKELKSSVENSGSVIKSMEESLPVLRHQEAEGIFSTETPA